MDIQAARITRIERVIRVYNGRRTGARIAYGTRAMAHELIYKWSGESVSRISGREYALKQGCVLYIPEGEHGSYSVETLRQGEAIDIFVKLEAPLSQEPYLFDAGQNARVKEMFESCHELWTGAQPSGALRCMSMTYGILAEIMDMASRAQVPPAEKRALDEAMAYFETHMFDAKFDYKEMAARTGMSYSYMKRVFIERLGMPPSKYLRERRIQYAKSLLLYPEYSVTQVAYSVGYDNLCYFSRVFKQTTGISPIEYRRRML